MVEFLMLCVFLCGGFALLGWTADLIERWEARRGHS